MLGFRPRIPRTWWICSNIALEIVFPKVLGFAVILYYFSIRDFLKLWPINYDPWSYVISIGIWYLLNHVVSTKFMIDMTILSSYCVISNHHVTVFIVVTAFIFKFSFCSFLLMALVPIIPTQCLFRGIYQLN